MAIHTDIAHVIWDWNGTLLDDVAACVEAINCMIRDRDLPHLDHDRYRGIFQFPVKNYYDVLGFDLENEDWDAIAREFHRHYDRTSREAVLRHGVETILAAFHESGMAMSILSASEIGILRTMLDNRGIGHYFEHVYGLSDLYASSKLKLGRALLAELGLPGEKIVLIGDTTHDYEVARDLGCRCLLLTGGHQSQERLQSCECRVIDDLEHLVELAQRHRLPGDNTRCHAVAGRGESGADASEPERSSYR